MNEEVKVRYETRISKKTNNPYDVLVLVYKGYEKIVFLENAEQFIFSDLKKKNSRGNDYEFINN